MKKTKQKTKQTKQKAENCKHEWEHKVIKARCLYKEDKKLYLWLIHICKKCKVETGAVKIRCD
jgi:hypothetical protein